MNEKTILFIAECLRVAYLRGKRQEDMTSTIQELRDSIVTKVENEVLNA